MISNVETVKEAITAALEFGRALKSFKPANFLAFYKAAKKLAEQAKKADRIKAAYKSLSPESRAYLRTYIRFGLNLSRADKDEKINALLEIIGHLKILLE